MLPPPAEPWLFIGLKLNEWAAFLAFVISLAALGRSVLSDRKSRELALRQKRQEQLLKFSQAEGALIADTRALKDLEEEALDEKDTQLATAAQEEIAPKAEMLAELRGMKAQLGNDLPPRKEWKALEYTLERTAAMLVEFDSELRKQSTGAFIDAGRRSLRQLRRLNQLKGGATPQTPSAITGQRSPSTP